MRKQKHILITMRKNKSCQLVAGKAKKGAVLFSGNLVCTSHHFLVHCSFFSKLCSNFYLTDFRSNHLINVTSSHIFCMRSIFYSKQIFYENILFSFELRASHFKQCSQCKLFSPTHFSTGVETGLARNSKENNVFS